MSFLQIKSIHFFTYVKMLDGGGPYKKLCGGKNVIISHFTPETVTVKWNDKLLTHTITNVLRKLRHISSWVSLATTCQTNWGTWWDDAMTINTIIVFFNGSQTDA